MYVTDRFAFVELHKTGGTHVTTLLSELVPGTQVGRHNRPSEAMLASGRKFLGSIRNPWDWYVSLWAYGCSRKGALYERLTRPLTLQRVDWRRGVRGDFAGRLVRSLTGTRAWKRCYADVNDPGAFRDWMHRLADPAWTEHLGEGYSASGLSDRVGFMSHRYMRLYLRSSVPPGSISGGPIDGLVDWCIRQEFVDYWIRNESLEDDLVAALRLAGTPLSDAQVERLREAPRTNVSFRGRKRVLYHDAATLRLVNEREALVITRFGYEPRTQDSAAGEAGLRSNDPHGAAP